MKARARLLPVISLSLLAIAGGMPGSIARAWGPHPTITQAALDVLPERERWEQALGAKNLAAMTSYCLLPDQRGKDLGTYYADDYLLIRRVPRHVGHVMPEVRGAFEPYYRRALQALRTETPENACRQIGPLIHFVEDAGAPPHAKPKCPHHTELENWVRSEEIVIAGYRPSLLGDDDEGALVGLLRRMDALVEFSKARAERALPLVTAPAPDRARVEPILLESALESARVTADVLYTVLALGLREREAGGARLAGTVAAPEIPGRDEHGARVVLLESDYATLATGSAPRAAGGWRGEYALRDLAPGRYRVLVYRTAALCQISEPVTLERGAEVRLDFRLSPTDPPGNLVENPDGRLSYLAPGLPDRWKHAKNAWSSTAIVVKSGAAYRCGAALRDPSARVRIEFAARPPKAGNKPVPPQGVPLDFAGGTRAETVAVAGPERVGASVIVESGRPLADVIERVWMVPADPVSR